jgi:hypothetical protein
MMTGDANGMKAFSWVVVMTCWPGFATASILNPRNLQNLPPPTRKVIIP